MKKYKLFISFHNYPLGEADMFGLTDILNLDVTDEGPAGRGRQSRLVNIIKLIKN